MYSFFDTYQPISMSRNHPYEQVLILRDHSLDTRKRRCYETSPVSQLADEHARDNNLEAEIMGGPGFDYWQ